MTLASAPLRIVMLAEGLTTGIGGIAIHASELGQALIRRGHTVVLISPEQFIGRHVMTRWRARQAGCPTSPSTYAWELPIVWTPRHMLKPMQIEWRWKTWLRRLVQKTNADVVHWHGLDFDSAVTRPVPPQCVGVFTNHSSQFLAMAQVDPAGAVRSFRHADRIIAPSQQLAEQTIAGGVSAHLVHLIPNGVDTYRFRPNREARERFRANHAIPPDAIVTIAARRFVEKNGLVYLAKAAVRLESLLKRSIVLCLAGDGEGSDAAYAQHVRTICGALDRLVDVRWLGWISTLEMPDALAAADIAVLPSLVEATSLAGLEAMASGCALLATRVGGIPELIDDQVSGRLVRPADDEDLAVAWATLIHDPTTRQRLAATARTKVERLFSWDRIAAHTEQVYQLALNRSLVRNRVETHHAPLDVTNPPSWRTSS